jgi:glycosyltransferase involved in cell wall biosynthesis
VQIAIDATPVVAKRKGIGSVLDGLISAASPNSLIGSARLFVDRSFAGEAARRWPGRTIEPVSFRSSLWWETVQLPKLLEQHRVEVLLTLRERTITRRGTKSVVWLFEDPSRRESIAREQQIPRSVVQKMVGRFAGIRLQRVAGSAAHFIVSSEFTRSDLMKSYGVESARISIIYPGLAPEFASDCGRSMVARDAETFRYVLHFATGDPRDNSSFALEVFAAAIRDVDEPVNLLLAGVPESLRTEITATAEALGIAGRIRVRGYVPVSELPSLYSFAEVYLDPTLLEGFGLQTVEAMASGVPVLSSNVSAVPEVCGEAALLFDPRDRAGFSSALASLLRDDEQRKLLSERGKHRATPFTWNSAIDSIERVIGSL